MELLLSIFLIMVTSLSGVLFLWKAAGEFIEKRLPLLVSLAAGVFAFVTYALLTEAFEEVSFFEAAIPFFGGIILSLGLFHVLPFFHHHYDEKTHRHSRLDARRIIFGDAVHNMGDGILLAAAFSAGPFVGVTTALGIFIHELVQEVSEFFVLRQAGFSVKKALLVNFAVSGTIFIGAFISIVSIEIAPVIEPFLLAFSAGVFAVVIVFDLLPHTVQEALKSRQFVSHLGLFTLGLLIMLILGIFAAHGHVEGEDHHEEEHLLHEGEIRTATQQ